MDKVINPLVESVTQGNLVIVAIIIVVAIIFNIEKIFSFLDARKKVKIQLIEESLNNSYVNGNTKLYLEDLIGEEYFKSITGIRLEKEKREELIRTFKSANGELNFRHFKRTIPYLTYQNSKLSVKLNVFSIFGFIYNFLFGFLSLIAGIILFILPAFESNATFTNMISMYGLALFLVFIGFLMLIQFLPAVSVGYVKEHLKKIEKNNNGLTTDSTSAD